MIGWEGIIGYEGAATADGRAIAHDALVLDLPVSLHDLPGNGEASVLVGSIKTVDRVPMPDGTTQLWATGAYNGGLFVPGDTASLGIDVTVDSVEPSPLVDTVTRGVLIGGHVYGADSTAKPAWPDCRIYFTAPQRALA